MQLDPETSRQIRGAAIRYVEAFAEPAAVHSPVQDYLDETTDLSDRCQHQGCDRDPESRPWGYCDIHWAERDRP